MPMVFFEALPVFRLTGAPDGWSLQVDDILPENALDPLVGDYDHGAPRQHGQRLRTAT